MIRIISVGLWASLVSLCAVFFAISNSQEQQAQVQKEFTIASYSFMRTELLTVPIMVDGEVPGYLMTQLIYAVDKKTEPGIMRSLSYFVNDEIFNVLFSAYSTTREVERLKFQDIKQEIIERVNARVGKALIKDLFVQQFGYISQKALQAI